jgi:hypothetical protein
MNNRTFLLMAPERGNIPPAVFELFPDHYFGINLILWVIFMATLGVMALTSIQKGRRKENAYARRTEFAFALFAAGMIFSRLFFIIAIAVFPNQYDFYCSVAYFFGNFGFAFLIASLEQTLETKRPIFTMLGIAATAISALGIIGFEREIILMIILILEVLMLFLVLILYLKIIKTAPGSIRRMAVISLVGMISLAIFLLLDGQFILSNPAVHIYIKRYLAPIGSISSLCLIIYGRREM